MQIPLFPRDPIVRIRATGKLISTQMFLLMLKHYGDYTAVLTITNYSTHNVLNLFVHLFVYVFYFYIFFSFFSLFRHPTSPTLSTPTYCKYLPSYIHSPTLIQSHTYIAYYVPLSTLSSTVAIPFHHLIQGQN